MNLKKNIALFLSALTCFTAIPTLPKITAEAESSAAVFDTTYTYTFCNAASGLYLEVADGTAEAGANVQQGIFGARKWTLLDAGNGYYKVYSEVGGGNSFLLSSGDAKTDNGTNISIWGDTESDIQLFKFAANGNGTYAIVTKATQDKSGIGIDSGSAALGANAIQCTLDGSDNQKWFPSAVIETTGTLIRDLTVSDIANVSGWGYDASLEAGDPVFGDRDAIFTDIPEVLIGAEVVRTACDSKNTINTLASFTAGADMYVYIAMDSGVENPPAWLSDYTETNMIMTNSENVKFRLFAREFLAGDPVYLSENGQSAGCVNYAVFAKAAFTGGDVNADGNMNLLDLIMLQKWLICVPDTLLTNWQAADLNEDGMIDAFDLCIMKSELLK